MRKLEGLRFLQENFSDLTVDCLFVDKLENLKDEDLDMKNQADKLWRVRAGREYGSELNLPQGTFKSKKEIRKFIKEQKQKDENMEFVIHRVSPKYFAAPFVGTLAVQNNKNLPNIRIELQKVTQELVDSIDKGKRPRDWEACLIMDYEFLNKFPKIRKKENVDLESLKYAIMVIHEVGEKIFEIYDKEGKDVETYTRFNIYDLGQVVLDDHRSSESFISKYKVSLGTDQKNTQFLNQGVSPMAKNCQKGPSPVAKNCQKGPSPVAER